MNFILAFILGVLTGCCGLALIRKLAEPRKPSYIIPVDDYSRFRSAPDQVR